MKNLLNPKWLFIINTLPIVVLIFLFIGEFNIIQSLLDRGSIWQWKRFGGILALLGGLNFAYSFYLIFKRQQVSVIYGFIALAAYILFIYLYFYNMEEIFPSNVPNWLLSVHPFLYVITFLMPTLIYSVFIIVTHFTPEDKEHIAWKNFLFAIVIPLGFYLFFQILLPLTGFMNSEFSLHAFIVIFITGTLLFLFFLIRGVYIFVMKKNLAGKKYQLLWKIPISILFPLLGLVINNGYWSDYSSFDSGVFGNFNSPWFYILAFVNGILICLPAIENTVYRLFLFIGRSITMAYTFYFFLVFLPFLPLSIVLILAIGAGFLTLTPLALFVIHVQELSKDFDYLKNRFSKHILRVISIIGFLIIPIYLTMDYLNDKRILNETLDYIYSPDYSKTYRIDKSSLRNTLQMIKSHKEDNTGFVSNPQVPYLSSYFNWLVLDNLTLSDTKIDWIEAVFFGYVLPEADTESISNKEVNISRISSQSVYEEQQKAWRSRVDLEITNRADAWFSEYATTIDLPEGCWISDYYLYVGDQKEAGILAEKKSAMWVFSQIRNTNRDPGILYYLTGNKVAFRVFPFAKDEVRKTGIEFLHKEPIQLNIDGYFVELGMEKETPPSPIIETDDVIYVPAQQKQRLKQVQRNPYFHFLVDVSKEKRDYFPDFSRRIKRLTDAYPAIAKNARISFVNTYVVPSPFDKDWEQTYHSQTFEGSFYLDRAIKTALFNAYSEQDNSYPILVVVTD
ncbi:MAG: MSEP-CTERM sorting domain-containing protein, partial [Tannerella sp.]|nr:MSEP-CTERM sorting domain-containing protein [Tannerella sp.]